MIGWRLQWRTIFGTECDQCTLPHSAGEGLRHQGLRQRARRASFRRAHHRLTPAQRARFGPLRDGRHQGRVIPGEPYMVHPASNQSQSALSTLKHDCVCARKIDSAPREAYANPIEREKAVRARKPPRENRREEKGCVCAIRCGLKRAHVELTLR